MGSLGGSMVKLCPPANAGDTGRIQCHIQDSVAGGTLAEQLARSTFNVAVAAKKRPHGMSGSWKCR